MHRAGVSCAGRKADRFHGRGGARDRHRRARAGVTLMVGHVERFNPAVQTVKQALAGEEILSIGITRVGPFPPRMSNVGVVIDLAVHDIDLIRWFTESDIVEVQPQLSSGHRRARGHRAPAIPHRERRARAYQHQLADAVQGAQRAGGDARTNMSWAIC
jgi:predicted dehydrogenase